MFDLPGYQKLAGESMSLMLTVTRDPNKEELVHEIVDGLPPRRPTKVQINE